MLEGKHFYEFGPFRLDPVERLLLRDGKAVSLTPKAFQLLSLLVENSGHLLTKDELLKRVWPETFVEEANLAQNISAIRRVLDDKNGGANYIETVAKGGYRFSSETRRIVQEAPTMEAQGSQPAAALVPKFVHGRWPVTRFAVMASAAILVIAIALSMFPRVVKFRAKGTLATPAATAIRSIAVLPLVNLSSDPAQEYFSDGLTDELITRLAKIGSLQVISHTSVFGYKRSAKKVPEIGDELHVDSVVEGTVERVNDRVRIRVQLIRASTDRHIWAESYDREIKDVLQLESDLAREIAQQIGFRTSEQPTQIARERLVSPDAYEKFLQGRYHWNRRTEQDLRQAVSLLLQAIALDPGYAPARAALAEGYALLGQYGGVPSQSLPKAKEAALQAVELDDTLPNAHAALAMVALEYEYDWARAESEFRRAIELNPNYASARQWFAEYLIAVHRTDDALQQMSRALEADPHSLIVNVAAGRPFFYARQYDRAIDQFHRALELDANFFPAHAMLGRALGQKGIYSEAIAEFHKALAIWPENPVILAELAFTLARSSQTNEAERLLRQINTLSQQHYISSYSIALVHAGLGQKDQAVEWLEKAYVERSTDIVHLGTDPRFDELRSMRRFRKLLVRIGLPS